MHELSPSLITLIVTNNTTYLNQCVESAIKPLVVFDGIPVPEDFNYASLSCNASRPSIARNTGLSKIGKCDYIQLLDSDDFLSDNYYETVLPIVSQNADFDVFYTDYTVLNEDFNFSHREYIKSVNEFLLIENLIKIKNPIIRRSVFETKKFNSDLTNFEIVDLMLQVGIDNIFHIPHSLQTVRIHPKGHNRLSNKESQKRSLNIINERMHGKV